MLPKRQLNDGVITFLRDTPKAPSENILIAFNRDLENEGYLDYSKAEVRELENLEGVFSLYLDYIVDAENVDKLVEGNFIAHPDSDLNFQLYEVVEVTKTLSDTGQNIRAKCIHIKRDLESDELIDAEFESATLEESALIALSGTRWKVGFVFSAGTRTYKVTDLHPADLIKQIESRYDVETRYRVVISGVQSMQFFVDFLPRRGIETGIDIEFKHNLQDIEIEVDTSDLVTALYGRGQGTDVDPETGETEVLDFFNFVWQETLGDPTDKPDNQGWVGDEDARLLWGKPDGQGGRKHIYGIYESQAQSQQTLLMETWLQVQRRKTPRITVEATIADLERASGYEHLKLRLGDTVRAKVPQFDVFLAARVIEIDRNKKNPQSTVVEIGNFRPLYTDVFSRVQGSVRESQQRQAVHNRAGLFEPDIGQEGYYRIDKILIGTDAVFSGDVEIGGDLIVGGSGVLSKFQFESSSDSPGVISQGWGDFGIARSGGDFFKGRVSIPVRVPDFFEITKAEVILLAMPIFFDGFDTPDGWRQSRSLKLYTAPEVEGYLEYIDASGSSNVFFRQGSDVSNAVLGQSTWSPTLAYSGSDPFNTQNKIESISGDITSILQNNRNINFYVETTLPETTWDDNHGLGKIIVRVEGYARPQS